MKNTFNNTENFYPKTTNEFDVWRLKYDSMTYQEQIEYHNSIEERYPDQAHYIYENVKACIIEAGIEVDVLEFGCWKADMAKQTLSDFQGIKTWTGIEICENAINKSKCEDLRFKYIFPSDFNWFETMETPKCDIIFATHFIEHLSNEHFEALVRFCKNVPYVYFEAPLLDGDQDWTGYLGTHKLHYGWDNVRKIMFSAGFSVHLSFKDGILFKSMNNSI